VRGGGGEEDASGGRGRPDGGEAGAGERERDSSERARVETGG